MRTKIISYLPIIIFILALSWRIIGLNAQGETWDEIAYFDAGKSYLSNIKHLNFDANNWDFNREHPPIGKYIYAFVSIPAYLEDEINYTYGRIASSIMGALTILIVFFLAKDLFSKKIATLASIILIFMPNLVGLNKVYGLDSPTLLFFTLTIYLFIRACHEKKHIFFILSGLSLGLAIGTRFSNAILLIFLPIIYLLIINKETLNKKNRIYLLYWLAIPIIAGGLLIATWPWLWQNTIPHLLITIGHWSPVKELFLGSIQIIPNNYYLVYLMVTTPIIILFLIIPFLVKLFIEKKENYFIVLFWLITCFLITLSPTKQGGMRYFICAYPAIAIMASIGFFTCFKGKLQYFFGLLLIFYLLLTNINIHPYYLTYYNELVGGTQGVYEKKLFPIGWWGEGIEEASIWLSQNAKESAKLNIESAPNHTTGRKLRNDITITTENPDYIIVNLSRIIYHNYKIPEGYQLVKTIRSGSTPFVWVYKN